MRLKAFAAVSTLLLTAAAASAAEGVYKTVPAAEAWRTGWPNMTGPTGNLLPLRSDTPLVADLAQAQLAWISEDRSLGTAKTGSQTWANSARVESYLGPEARNFKGNWAGVVLSDGRIYGSSWVPAGKVYTAPYKTNRPYQKGETELVPTRFRVEAEDIVNCYDANTGALLWQAKEPGGLIRAGGKRGGLQVAMAIDGGRAFALGSTGRLFAYDATTGKKLWQGDVGPAHGGAEADKQAAMKTAESGSVVIPDGVGWFTSLVVADGILVTGDYSGGQDVGLRGYDAATGTLKWQLPKTISKYATPSVWKHNGKAWLLTGTMAGTLQLIDPQTGKLAWQEKGLGPLWGTLSPGEDTVMVNVKTGTGKRVPGIWGAYRISPEKGELAWKMGDEPRNYFSTWLDTGARQHAFVRDGRVLLHTEGSKAERVHGRALLLDARDGKVLAESPQVGSDLNQIDELVIWLGDRAFVRADHSHGPNHGGRHPLIQWITLPGQLQPVLDDGKVTGLDLIDFDGAYEVLMHVPMVDGRMFERMEDGRLACYDLRAIPNVSAWTLALQGGYIGMSSPMTVRVWTDGQQVTGGKAWIPDGAEAALPAGTVRRRFTWERAIPREIKATPEAIAGTMLLSFGTHHWPVNLTLQRKGDEIAGTWVRKFAPAAKIDKAEGTLLGEANTVRGFPTPWLKDTPWSPFGKNAPGARTIVMGLDGAVARGDQQPRGLTLSFDHDGKTFTRAAGVAFQYSQAWHEVDASALTLVGEKVTGKVHVVLNTDPYLSGGNPDVSGIVGVVELDATIGADGKVTGRFTAEWGHPWEVQGKVSGAVGK